MKDEELKALREEIFEDGKVTKEEVIRIWDEKDKMEETTGEFDALFSEVVMAWLMADDTIDEEEAAFLIEKINEDESIDDAEDELLQAIADTYRAGTSIPASLIAEFPDYFEELEEDEDEE